MTQRVFDFDKKNPSKSNLGLAKKIADRESNRTAENVIESMDVVKSTYEALYLFCDNIKRYAGMTIESGMASGKNVCSAEVKIPGKLSVYVVFREWDEIPDLMTMHVTGSNQRDITMMRKMMLKDDPGFYNVYNSSEVTMFKGIPKFFNRDNPAKLSKSLVRWCAKKVNQAFAKRLKIELKESKNNLGLAKKTRQQAQGRDAVENISVIPFEDPEVERICHEHDVYTIGDAAQVTSIKDWFVSNRSGVIVIKTFNEFKYFTGLKSVEDYAFYDCESLQSINIPNSVTRIGISAFGSCESLQSINIPDSVTSIGRYAFGNCWSLQSINIPDSVTSIEPAAFHWCKSLQSINIPDSVTSIGDSAFEYCKALEFANIPDGVTIIKEYTFDNCCSLQSINIPNSVTSIGPLAFAECKSLQSVNLSNSITSIEFKTFKHCDSLQSINIPDSVTSIGESAFHFCKSLQSIVIPDSVTSIGDGAFYWCKSLQSIVISKNCLIYYKIKRNYPNIQLVEPTVNESNLGLAKKTRDQAESRDAIDNIGYVDNISDVAKYFMKSIEETDIAKNPNIEIYEQEQYSYIEDEEIKVIKIEHEEYPEHAGLTVVIRTWSDKPGMTIHMSPGLRSHLLAKIKEMISESKVVKENMINVANNANTTIILTDKEDPNKMKISVIYEMARIASDLLVWKARKVEHEMKESSNLGLAKKVASKSADLEATDTLETLDVDTFIEVSKKLVEKEGFKPRDIIIEDSDFPKTRWLDKNRVNTKMLLFNNLLSSYGEEGLYRFSFEIDQEEEKFTAFAIWNSTSSYFGSLTDIRWLDLTTENAEIVIEWIKNKSRIEVNRTNESELGLAKKARHKAEGKDAVNNVSVISFEDPLVKEICNSHDIYTYEDAANVDSLYSVSNNRGLDLWFHGMPINKFNELKWFTGLKSIKASTFSYCSHLQEITLPEGITSIEAHAFRGCESLKKIVVPEGVKYIYNHAFAECKTIEEIYLPSTLQKVGMGAFADINKDAIIRVPSGWNKNFIYLDNKKVVIDGVNESNLGLAKKTRSQAEGKNGLEGFLYVHSVDEAVECFKNAIKKTGILDKGITMVEIDRSNRGDLSKTSKAKLIKLSPSPSDRFGLNAIIREWPDEEGFTLHCGGELKKIFKDEILSDPLISECIVNLEDLGKFLPMIGNQTDRNMMSVEVIKRAAEIAADILKSNCDLSESNLGLAKKVSKDASKKDAINNLIIDFKDPIVEKICHDNGIYTKEDAAAISYNDIVSDVYVHKFTFKDTKIETFDEFQYFTGLQAIPYAWFAGCNELKSIVIPDNLNYIGDFAFNKTNSLEKIIIPRTVDRIARSAFSSSGIREVVFEEPTSSKIEIESSAFLHCDNLTEVTLPSGLKWMRDEVFWQCKSLKDVWIPANSNIDYVHVSMFRKACGNEKPEGDRVTIHIANKDLYLRLLDDIFEANIIKKEKVTIVYSGNEPLEESSLGLAKKVAKDKEGKKVESVIEEMDIISYEEACSKLSFMQSSRDESVDDLFKYKYFDEAIINENDLKVFVEVGVINDKDYGDFDFLTFSLYAFLGISFVKDYIDWILPGAKVVSTEKISSINQNTSSLPYVLSNTNLAKVRDAIEDMKSRGQLYFEALERKEKPQAYSPDGSNEKGVTKDDIIDCLEEVFKDYITKDPYDYGVKMMENNNLVCENKEEKLTPGMILEADKGNICEAIKETSGLEAKLRFDKEDGLIKNIRLVVEKDNHKYHRDIKLDEILENASIEKPEELWMSPNDVEVNEAIAKAASSLIGSRPRK